MDDDLSAPSIAELDGNNVTNESSLVSDDLQYPRQQIKGWKGSNYNIVV